MGQSTDAILFFGVCFEEGFEFPWSSEEDDEDWEDYAAKKLGVQPPQAPWDESMPGVKEDYRRYWKECREAVEKLECEIGRHCYIDYPCSTSR